MVARWATAALLLSSAAAFRPAAVLVTKPLHHATVRQLSVQAVDISSLLYDAQMAADVAVKAELSSVSPVSTLVMYGAGLLTSLSPCCLSMLPLTMGYIGSMDDDDDDGVASFGASLAFSGGLACCFCALGVAASSAGAIFGSDGQTLVLLRCLVSAITLGMGLNLLQVLPLSLPSIELGVGGQEMPRTVRAFLFGASSALVASPCASPVLASLLGFLATQGDPTLGVALLLAFTVGYTSPVLLAGLLAGSARKLATFQSSFTWVVPASGSVLVAVGTYNGLSSAFGAV